MPSVNLKQPDIARDNSWMASLQSLDTRTLLAVPQHPQRELLTRIALATSCSADGWLYLLLLPAIAILKPDATRDYLHLAFAAFALERTLYFCFKNLFRRRRPPAAIAGFQSVITAADRFSLPSGHTSAAFLFVTFLCVGLHWIFLPLYIWAMAVGASRVILGVHFPSDIVLGALLGSSIGIFIL
jgi:undecaprenyl-diphosphatase